MPWLDDRDQEKSESIVTWTIRRPRKRGNVNIERDSEIKSEISKRLANERQDIDKLKYIDTSNVRTVFLYITDDMHSLLLILSG